MAMIMMSKIAPLHVDDLDDEDVVLLAHLDDDV